MSSRKKKPRKATNRLKEIGGRFRRTRYEALEARICLHDEDGPWLDHYQDDSAAMNELLGATPQQVAQVLNAAPAVTGTPATVGQWGPLQNWPIEFIEALMLPTGKVLGFDRTLNLRLWDPVTNVITQPSDPGYNIFCSGISLLADGTALVTGGHVVDTVGQPFASIYNPFNDTWTPLPNMNAGRWYPANTTLANGDVLVLSGTTNGGNYDPLPQVYDVTAGKWIDLTTALQQLPFYPRTFSAPNGDAFVAGPQPLSEYLDTTGTGLWIPVANRVVPDRNYGSAVMYAPGKVLYVGGGSPATNSAEIIDLNQPNPTWTAVSPMAFARRNCNATLLPDGEVLVTGGNDGSGQYDGNADLAAEIWNPQTLTFTTLSSESDVRWYHSTALLLPNGTVVSGSGDLHLTEQIFSPPYLFTGTAQPTISSAPGTVRYGDSFFVGTPDAASITNARWIRLGTSTHAQNWDQYIQDATFTQTTGGLMVSAPPNPNSAPPGYYYLFILKGNVPSIAKIIKVGTTLPTLSVANTTVTEGATGVTTNAVFQVNLSLPSAQTVMVSYATADGTALAGHNYVAKSGTLTFNPLVTSQFVTVAVTGDGIVDPNETFSLNLSLPVAATLAQAQGQGLIRDFSLLPVLQIQGTTQPEGNSGTTNFNFVVTLSAPSTQKVTVAYSTADGTATAGTDYVTTSGVLTFAPGVTQQTIPVPVVGDTIDEINNQFYVNLSAPSGATIEIGQAAGVILDDDTPPTAGFSTNAMWVPEPANGGTTNLVVGVSLSGPSGKTVVLPWVTNPGTATAGINYVYTLGKVTFLPGQTQATLTVPILGDSVKNPDEVFYVQSQNEILNANYGQRNVVVTVQNSDALPAISLANSSVTEANTGTTPMVFTATLTSAMTQAVTVNYQTSAGTATAGTDYTEASGTITFAAGATTQTFTVSVKGDTTPEADETFNVTLSNPVNAVVSVPRATGTIIDNDGAPIPATPVNVTALPGFGSAVLSWQASSGATSYSIYRSTSLNGEGTTPVMTGVVGTSYTDSGLLNGTTYYYRVTAVNTQIVQGGNNQTTVAYESAVSSEVSVRPSTYDFSNGFITKGSLISLNGINVENIASFGSNLQLTDGGTDETDSVFTVVPTNVSRFTTQFTFQQFAALHDTDPISGGLTFTIQSASNTALGAADSGLGYAGITNSVAVKFDLTDDAGEGPNSTGLYVNGASPTVANSINLTGSGINLHSSDLMNVSMTYDGATLAVTITDTVTHAQATQSYSVNIPGIVGGNMAYVGFTASTEQQTVVQQIPTWVFTPAPSAPTNLLVTSLSSTQNSLTWTNTDPNTTSVLIERRSGTTGSYVQIGATTSASANSYVDTTAVAGTAYFYRVRANDNGSTSVASNEVSVAVVSGLNFPQGFAGAAGQFSFNGASAKLNGSSLQLTDNGTFEAASIFATTPQTVTGFATQFTILQANGTNPSADGMTFTIQGNGPTALGFDGGNLGYGGIFTNSLAIKFDLYDSAGEGPDSTGLYIDGPTPPVANSVDLRTTGIDLHSGHPMNVGMTYDGTTLAVTITDTVTLAQASQSYTVNIPSIVGGNTAYVGFTGATGGGTAIQSVQNWTFVPAPAAPTNLTAPTVTPSQVGLSWTNNDPSVTGVLIERKTGANGVYAQIGSTSGATANTYSDTTVIPGTTYFYRVRATNNGSNSLYSNELSVMPPVIQADLQITNDDGVTALTPGSPLTYTVVVTNAGPNSVTGATVSDIFPSALINPTFTATTVGAATGFTASGTGNLNDVVTMPAGSSIKYLIQGTVSTVATGSMLNAASVTAPAGVYDPNLANNSATDVDSLSPLATDLQITNSDGQTTAAPGSVLTYTIVVTNAGPTAVAGATVTDAYPTNLGGPTYTAVGAGGASGYTQSGSGGLNEIVNLPVGATITYTLTGTVSPAATGTLVNSAAVGTPAGTSDSNPANNGATDIDTVTPFADLQITNSDGQTSAVPGAAITYTIVVTNNGPNTVTGATVTDAFPATLTAVTYTATPSGGATGFTASGSGNLNDVVTLPVAGTIAYTVHGTVSPSATGTLSNTAAVTAPAGVTDTNTTNNSATDSDAISVASTINYPSGFAGAAGQFSFNGASAKLNGSSLQLTDNGTFEAASIFATTPQTVTGFATQFTILQANGTNPSADGMTFTIQGNGPTALGFDGGNLGYGGIFTNSLAIKFDLYDSAGEGPDSTGLYIDGPTPPVANSVDLRTTGIDLHSGHPMNVGMTYDGTTLAVTITDTVTLAQASQSYTVNIPSIVGGNTAYVGFTGATGGGTAIQSVQNWTFVPAPAAPTNLTAPTVTPSQVGLSWTNNDPSVTGVLIERKTGANGVYAQIGSTSGATANTYSDTTVIPGTTYFYRVRATNNGSNSLYSNELSVMPPVIQADLQITNDDGVTALTPGSPLTYTVVVTNAGPNSVTGATVTDAFPAALTAVTYTATPSGGATGFTASGSGNLNDIVTLPAASTITYTVHGIVSPAATGSLANTAAVAAPAGVTDTNGANNSALDTDTLTPQADLQITNTDGQTTSLPGSAVAYTIVVTNAGPSAVTGAVVTDMFPATLTSVTYTATTAGGATGFTASGSGNLNDTVTVPAGSTITYVVHGTVSQTATGTLTDTATVTAPIGVTEINAANNSATDSDTVTVNADLQITNTDGQASAIPGSAVTYTIVVTNAGPNAVTGAVVADAFPATLTSVTYTTSATGNATGFTASGSGNLNDTVSLPVGSTITYVVQGALSLTATGTLSNTSTVTAPAGVTDSNLANNTATDIDGVGSTADLQITNSDGQTSAVPGAPITYTIVVTNAGPSTVIGAAVADVFPTNLAAVTYTATSSGGAAGYTLSGSGNLNDTVNLPAGSTITYTVRGTLSTAATGSLADTAAVSVPAGVTDTNPANNSALDTDTLTPQADLQIANTDYLTSAVPGNVNTYVVIVSNAGPSDVIGANVVMNLPDTLTGVSVQVAQSGGASGATAGSGNINQTVNVPVGGIIYYYVQGTINPAASGTLSTTATVNAPNGIVETNSANNSALDTDTLTPQADLQITNTDGQTTAIPGSAVTYTVVVTNSGPSAVTGATVADTFPASLTSVTYTATATGNASGFTASGSGNISDAVTMPVGSTITYVVHGTLSASATGTMADTAAVAVPAGVTDTNAANNSATDTDTVTPQADLQITNTDGQTTAVPGSAITYTVVVTNSGPSAVTGATVADTFPATLTSVTYTATATGNASGFTTSGSGNISDAVTMPVGSTITYVVHGTLSTSATGTMADTAAVAAPAGVTDTNAANNSATDTDTVTPQADLQITNTDGQTTAVPGSAITYTVVVTNAGPSAVTGATVVDTFPASLTSVTYTATATGNATGFTASGSGNLSNTVTMPVGSAITYVVHGTVSATATGSLADTATITVPAGVTETNSANNSAIDTDTLTPQADLQITNTDGQTSAVPGSAITYTVVVTNAGPSAVTGATVADTFPATLTSVTYTATATGNATGFTASGSGNLSNTVTMPVGSSITYIVHGTVIATATGSLADTATIAVPAGVTETNSANNSAIDTDTLTPQADLQITNTDGQTTAVPGSAITYTVVVTNAGPSAVTGATVADTFPASLTSVTYTATATGNATGFTASGSGNLSNTVTMPVGSTITYVVHGTLSASATGTLVDTATVAAPAGVTEINTANNSATDTDTVTANTDLQITNTDGQTSAVPGSAITYTIVVTNAGPAGVTGAVVADAFPATITSLTYTAVTTGAATGFTVSGSGNLNDTVAMPVGSTITYTVHGTVAATATGSLADTATVTAPAGITDTNTTNNSATDTDTLTPKVDLQITNTDGQTSAVPGSAITYTIVATNAGPSSVTGAIVTDTLPSTITSPTYTATAAGGATGFTASGSGNLSNTLTMPVGSTVTYVVRGTVSASATGSLANTAAIAAPTGVTETNSANNSVTDTDTLTPQADLRITNTDGATTAAPGATLTYTIVVTNAGPSLVTGAKITDTFPSTLSSITYTATTTGAATGFTASGSGNISNTVTMPVGSTITYVVKAKLSATATGTVADTAAVAAPTGLTDTNTANNSATDTDTITVAPTINYPSGFSGASAQFAFNGATAQLVGSALQLTTNGASEAASIYAKTAQTITQFNTQFSLSITNGTNPSADGMTFVIQGVGTTALGGNGGNLGYGGISKSVAIKFDLYSNVSEGIDSTGLYTNGPTPPSANSVDLTSTGIDLHSGHILNVNMSYNGTTLTVTLTDATTLATATQNYTVNIPSIVGANTAYVGFTGGTGGLTANQSVLNWVYTPAASGGSTQAFVLKSAVTPTSQILGPLPSNTGVGQQVASTTASTNSSSNQLLPAATRLRRFGPFRLPPLPPGFH